MFRVLPLQLFEPWTTGPADTGQPSSVGHPVLFSLFQTVFILTGNVCQPVTECESGRDEQRSHQNRSIEQSAMKRDEQTKRKQGDGKHFCSRTHLNPLSGVLLCVSAGHTQLIIFSSLFFLVHVCERLLHGWRGGWKWASKNNWWCLFLHFRGVFHVWFSCLSFSTELTMVSENHH